jgi:hypothetical protein
VDSDDANERPVRSLWFFSKKGAGRSVSFFPCWASCGFETKAHSTASHRIVNTKSSERDSYGANTLRRVDCDSFGEHTNASNRFRSNWQGIPSQPDGKRQYNGAMNKRKNGNSKIVAICTGFVGECYAYSPYGAPVFMPLLYGLAEH